MIGRLLFPEVKGFSVESIAESPLSVEKLIEAERAREVGQVAALVAPSTLNPLARDCAPFRQSTQAKRLKREESEQVLDKWHGFKRRELTEEDERDLLALRLKRYIDPRGYGHRVDELNKNYMQLGTVIADPMEGRAGAKGRRAGKGRVWEQLRQADQAIGFTERKFKEIQEAKMKGSRNKRWLKLKKAKGKRKVLDAGARELDFN